MSSLQLPCFSSHRISLTIGGLNNFMYVCLERIITIIWPFPPSSKSQKCIRTIANEQWLLKRKVRVVHTQVLQCLCWGQRIALRGWFFFLHSTLLKLISAVYSRLGSLSFQAVLSPPPPILLYRCWDCRCRWLHAAFTEFQRSQSAIRLVWVMLLPAELSPWPCVALKLLRFLTQCLHS